MKSAIIVFFFLISFTNVFSQKAVTYPFQNPKLPVEQRVKDLISRMSLHEKILQMQHFQDVKGIEAFKGESYGCIMSTGSTASEVTLQNTQSQNYMKKETRWGIPVLTVTEALHEFTREDVPFIRRPLHWEARLIRTLWSVW